MNIYQKLVEVRKVVPYLQKAAKSSQYMYVSSSQVLSSVVDKMNELNLLLVPKVIDTNIRESTVEYEESEKPKRTTTYFTELIMLYTWINADKPDEKIECPWYGQGVDIAGEKGVGKALTYSEKYFMLKFFNVATDKDDPDSFNPKTDNPTKPDNTPKTNELLGNLKQMIWILSGKSKEKSLDFLEEYTSFTNKEGKEIKGTRDWERLSEKQTKMIHDKVKKEYDKLEVNK